MTPEARQNYSVTFVFFVAACFISLVIAFTPAGPPVSSPLVAWLYAILPAKNAVPLLGCMVILVLSFLAVLWILRSGAILLKGEIHIVCWRHYTSVLREISATLRKSHGILLKPIVYTGKEIYEALAHKEPIDLIIFDIEALPDLLDPINRFPALKSGAGTIPKLRALTSYEDIFGKPFAQPLRDAVFPQFLAVHDNQTYGFPLRFGMNALSYSVAHINAERLLSYAPLLEQSDELHRDIVKHHKLGIFDWYLPTMGTLSVALKNQKPFQLQPQEFSNLKLQMKTLRSAVYKFYSDPESLMHDLERGSIWVVPGGGEWHIPVRGSARYNKSLTRQQLHKILTEHAGESLSELSSPIDWVIPVEGGLYWVECIGVSGEFATHEQREGCVKPDLLRELLKEKFLDPWRQQIFTRLALSRANTVVKGAITTFPPGQQKLLRTYTNAGIEYRADRLIRREYPPNASDLPAGSQTVSREAWETFWDEEFKPGKFVTI